MTAYAFEPPIGRLLLVIREHIGVGGCFRPGNRQLADWLGYASAGHIHHLLDQLACDGRILYDRDSRLITLLSDPSEGSVIPLRDQDADRDESQIDPVAGSIPPRDRFFRHQDAADPSKGSVFQSDSQCMESLVATTSESDQVVVVDSGGMQGGDQKADRSQGAAQLMAELGANPKIIADAFASRPDWTAQQVRARWEYDQRRIATSDGKLNEGVFFTALRAGELAPARPDPARPLDPADYAGDPAFRLGSDAGPPEAESIRDHASRLLPAPTAATIREHTRDWMYLQCRLGAGDSDDAALAALATHRSAVRR